MAYQPYPYNGYQPAPYYTQPVPDQLTQLRMQQGQPTTPNMQQPQPIQTPPVSPANPMAGSAQNGMIWVSGQQEADSYLIAPNSAVALWDANNPVVYLRKADSTGKPSTVVYDLVERTGAQVITPAPTAQKIDWDKIVTWDKLDDYLAERLKKTAKTPAKKEED